MSDYGFICDVHYSLLKQEQEEFSSKPLVSEKCDFCEKTATHWLPHKLSPEDFKEKFNTNGILMKKEM